MNFWSSYLMCGGLPAIAMAGNGWYTLAVIYAGVILVIGLYFNWK